MAEERLMDDDKDKKYRFRKNENGEEELIIEGGDDTDEVVEEMSFEVPEDLDDEEAAVMTPEQLAEKERQRAEEKERLNKQVTAILDSAEKDFNEGKYATALEALAAAEELDDENGRLYTLKLKVFTQNFTDYSHLAEAADAAEDVGKYSSSEDKAAMLSVCEGGLKANIAQTQKLVDELGKENQEKKEERAVKFKADRNKSVIVFAAVAIPFVVMLALAIYFATIMFSAKDGHYIMYAIIFAAIAVVFLIATVFCARWLNITTRRVRLNKKNTTTKLGRQFLEEEEKLNNFNKIYSSLKE